MPSSSHCRRILISGWFQSTSARICSVEHADFFFEPVQFDLQAPDLLVQRVAVRFPARLSRPPVHEQFRQLVQRGLPPLRDLVAHLLESNLAELLTLPAAVTLTGSVSGSLNVDLSGDEPAANEALDATGNYSFAIGGKLTIPAGTVDGVYSGRFNVTANYQ